MGRYLKVAVLSLVLFLVLALSSRAALAEVLKLGVLATLSGAGTGWGTAMQGAAELAAEDVNARAGLDLGGEKYKIEVLAYDDHYKAANAFRPVEPGASLDRKHRGAVGRAPHAAGNGALPSLCLRTREWPDRAQWSRTRVGQERVCQAALLGI